MKIRTSYQGFTLVEIMLAVAIFTFMCAGLTGALLAGRSAWTVNQNSSKVQQQGRNVLSVMTKDFHQADGLKTALAEHSVNFSFTHPTDGKVSYTWDKTTQQVSRTAQGKTRVVGTNVSDLSVTGAGPAVEIALTVASTSANNQTDTMALKEKVVSSNTGSTGGSVNQGGSTPTAQAGSTTPTAQAGSTTPTAQAGSTTPTAQAGSTTPTAQAGSTTPTAEASSTTPTAEASSTTPTAEASSTTPTAEADSATPTADAGSTTPTAEADSATPTADAGSTTPTAQAGSMTHGFTIPIAHPRLWWNTERLAKAQAWYAAHGFTPASSDYQGIAWKHVVTGSSCASAITWAMAREVSYAEWQPSGNGSDEARWYGGTAILIYDWCNDALTTQQKSDFLHNINGSGYGWNDYLNGIRQQTLSGNPTQITSNYNWGTIGDNIAYGIATYTENTTLAETLLDDAINSRWGTYFVGTWNSSVLAGGVSNEGSAYGTSMMGSMMPFQTMDLLGRDIYNEIQFFKDQIYWVIYSTTPAVTYHTLYSTSYYQMQTYADDEQWTEGGMINARNYYQNFMNFASNYWSSINVGKDARQWYNTIMAGNGTKAVDKYILAQDLSPSARATSNLPLDFYATGMQYMYGRKAWDTSSTYFWWQMGSGGSGHEHKDTGNFHIWRNGRWLTRETPGYCDWITGYGYANNRIGNAQCGCGDGGRTGEVSENMIVFGTPLGNDTILMPTVFKNSVMKRLESTTGYSYADVDMTNEYHWDGYAENERHGAVHVEREFLFLRDLETTVIFDRITTGNITTGVDVGKVAADVVNTFLLHSEVNPTLEDATHITITNGNQVLRVTTLVPSSPTRRVIDENSCTGCGHQVGQYRIELDTSGAAQRYFLNILQARASSDANITASVVDSAPGDPTTGTFTVTLHPVTGYNTVIVFNKGQTSSGGTVSLAGANALHLRAGVQTISYTDDGPVWLDATCGDGSCSGGKTCSNCAADCGPCP